MSKPQSARIASILRLRKGGKSYTEIATQFGITPAGVRQIFERFRDERQRADLIEKYGARPRIGALPDSTPLEVLTLCDGKMRGWAARLSHLTKDLKRRRSDHGSNTIPCSAEIRKAIPEIA